MTGRGYMACLAVPAVGAAVSWLNGIAHEASDAVIAQHVVRALAGSGVPLAVVVLLAWVGPDHPSANAGAVLGLLAAVLIVLAIVLGFWPAWTY